MSDDRETDGPADPGDVDLPASVRTEQQRHLRTGIRLVREMIERGRADFMVLCRKHEHMGWDPPAPHGAPCASWPSWVEQASKILVDTEATPWVAHRDLAALDEDLASVALAAMRELPEHDRRLRVPYPDGEPVSIDLRWTLKLIVRRSPGEMDEMRCGRAKAIPEAERMTWRGPGEAPYFRLELSLPWFLLAAPDEVEHGLHDLLAYCHVTQGKDPKPKIGKPDIVAWASTLGRFGVRYIREAKAIAHAQANPSTRAQLRAFGYDPAGQGLMSWAQRPAVTPQVEPPPKVARPVRPARPGKDAAAEPREPEFTADPDEQEH